MPNIKGIFAASITPLQRDYTPDLEALPIYLDFLAHRGCHGALLLGTTGEGPSFSPDQRVAIFRSAAEIRQEWPDFKLLAGTGTPSLDETIQLTRSAFDCGLDGVVVLPPYYFRDSADSGLLSWFSEVIDRSVPEGGHFFVYHIPGMSRIPISINLLSNLLEKAPNKFSGLKDSSGDSEFAARLGEKFGEDLSVFTGNDRLISTALNNHASGCITALANLISPDLKSIWDAHSQHESTEMIQTRVDHVRNIADKFAPFPPLIKFLLNHSFEFPYWPVCPPLEDLSPASANQVSRLIDLA
ncbi:MAG: dihydrodipicolinate synthase family protein [Anaerolineales bacterium]|jgi:4-hydroxy-tetrahydrodipicolinate synthase